MTDTVFAALERLATKAGRYAERNGLSLAPITSDGRHLLRVLGAAVAVQRESDRLRAACQAMADDYQVSEVHHPDHVLVPVRAFDEMRVCIRTLLIAENTLSRRAREQDEAAQQEARS